MRFFTFTVALLVSLASASSIERRTPSITEGPTGVWTGKANAKSLITSQTKTADIPGIVMRATREAHALAIANGGAGQRFIMAGLYCPDKDMIYFATQPRGNLVDTIKQNPGHFHLTATDVRPIPHAEQLAYSKALEDGAPEHFQDRSYMAAYGNYNDGNECKECCAKKCEPWLKAHRINGNEMMSFARSNAPSPASSGPSSPNKDAGSSKPKSPPSSGPSSPTKGAGSPKLKKHSRRSAGPEDSPLARILARAETVLGAREEQLARREMALNDWEHHRLNRRAELVY